MSQTTLYLIFVYALEQSAGETGYVRLLHHLFADGERLLYEVTE